MNNSEYQIERTGLLVQMGALDVANDRFMRAAFNIEVNPNFLKAWQTVRDARNAMEAELAQLDNFVEEDRNELT